MKAIMTVIGEDRVGIVANVSCLLAEMGVNILDISQTIMEGIFTMTILVDTATSQHSFDEISSALTAKGEESGLSIRIQRRDLFTAMHRI